MQAPLAKNIAQHTCILAVIGDATDKTASNQTKDTKEAVLIDPVLEHKACPSGFKLPQNQMLGQRTVAS